MVATFFIMGPHPACLAQKTRYFMRTDGVNAIWNRAKTGKQVVFPLAPELLPWWPSWMQALPETDPYRYRNWIHRAGELWLGMPQLGPRALRHTAIWRCIKKYGVDVAMQLFEVSPGILIRYAKRIAAESVMRRISIEGFATA